MLTALLLGAGAVAGCKVDLGAPEMPSSTIVGQVALTSNAPLANVSVKVTGGGVEKNVQTGGDGKYTTAGLTSGTYMVEVVPPAGYAVADGTYGQVAIALSANDSKTVNFRLQAN